MAVNEPWSKFFWSDYDADEGLRVCSLAAQGLWMRMLCLMARATPKGELRIGGEPCTVADLSKTIGEPEEMVAALLGELQRRGVFSTTRAGVIYSRRLRKDAEISRKRAISGKKGGLISSGKKADNQVCSSKIQANVEAKSKPQKPEARSQSNTTASYTPVSARDGDEITEAMSRVCTAASMAAPPGDYRRLAEWIGQGADVDLDILPTVKRIADAVIARGDRPRTFKLFEPDVLASVAHRNERDDADLRRYADIAKRYPGPSIEPAFTERKVTAA